MAERSGAAIRLLVRHAAKFSAVGLAGAALDYSILLGAMHLGVEAAFARIPAVGLTLIFTWILNRTLTFHTKNSPSWNEFIRYALAAFMGIFINLTIYWAALLAHADVWLAFVLGTGTAAVYTFLTYRKLLHGG